MRRNSFFRRLPLSRVRNLRSVIAFVLGLVAASAVFAQAPNSIESMEFAYARAGRTVVRLQLAAPVVSLPATTTVNNPPKVTLDFADTVTAFKRRAVDVNDVVLRSVHIVPDGNRTRVVFTLDKPQFVDVRAAGDVVIVTLSDRALEPPAPSTAVLSVPAPPAAQSPAPASRESVTAAVPPTSGAAAPPTQALPSPAVLPSAPQPRIAAPVATGPAPGPRTLSVPPPPPVHRVPAPPPERAVPAPPVDSIPPRARVEDVTDAVEAKDSKKSVGDEEAGTAGERGSRITGFYQFEGAYTTPSPAHFSKLKNRLEASWSGQFSGNLKWKLGGGVFYDPVYDLGNFYPGAVRRDQRFDAIARENYLDWSTGDFDFRFGRQQIIWGEVVSLFVADVVSARDLREFVLPDFDLIRIPQWAARGEYFKDDFHAEAIFVPRVSVDRIGKPGADFYPYPPVPPAGFGYVIRDEIKPSSSLANASYGMRLSYLKEGWDGAVFYYRSTDASPTFSRGIVDGSAPAYVYTPMHGRISQAGATLSKDFDSFVFKLESVYTSGHDYNVDRLDATAGLVRQNTFDYILAIDVPLPLDTRFNAQFFQRLFRNYDPGTGFDRLESEVSFLISRQLTSTLTPELLVVTSVNRNDWMIRPKVTWVFAKNWRLVGGVDFFGGSPSGFSGRYNDKDRTYLELRYSF